MGNIIELLVREHEEPKLWQWDTDRKISISTDNVVDEVHYSNAFSTEALVVKPTVDVELGKVVADIPNILLQNFTAINIYVVMHTENGARTTFSTKFDVSKRARPSDYVYTETEVMSYKELEERVSALEEGGGSGGITKEVDPTVPEWAKQPTKPSYTAEEVGADKPVKRIEKSSSDTQATLKPNELYVFPEMAELSVDLEANPDTDIVSEYHFIFTSGSTATVLSLPEDVKVPSNFLIEPNKAYEISVLEMMMLVQSWEIN